MAQSSHGQNGKPVALVIGASRGIGRQVAIDLAREGYRVVVSAKSVSPPDSSPSPSISADPTPPSPTPESSPISPPPPNSRDSTITTVALEIAALPNNDADSVRALPVDVRSPTSISELISTIHRTWGRLDVIVYNAGAIWWGSVSETPFKRFKFMSEINMMGLYATVSAVLPFWEMEKQEQEKHKHKQKHDQARRQEGFGGAKTSQQKRKGREKRIIVVSPPIYSRFFRGKTAYAMGKVGMSVLTKGLAMDWKREGKDRDPAGGWAITSLWPAASIVSAATKLQTDHDQDLIRDLRKPTIFSDAILEILRAPAEEVNGLLDTDEDLLRRKGVTDFGIYSVVPGAVPRRIMPRKFPALEVDEQDDEGRRVRSVELRSRRSKL